MKSLAATTWILLTSWLIMTAGCGKPVAPSAGTPAAETNGSPDAQVDSPTKSAVQQPQAAGRVASLPLPRRRVDRKGLEAAITRSGDYLVASCDEQGRFRYVAHPDSFIELPLQYNVLRHIGAIHGLARYQHYAPSASVRAAIDRSLMFLRDHCLRPLEETDDMLAVWSDPQLTGQPTAVAKLGGAALAIIAMDAINEIEAGTVPVAELQQLGRFLTWMQKSDGSFYSLYTPARGGRDDSFQSQFYPGEATLALLLLARHDPAGPWRTAATGAMTQLARSQSDRLISTPDQWALLAGGPLLKKLEPSTTRGAIVEHLARTADDMLNDQLAGLADLRTTGCYTADGQTCPTATRLEGLLATLTYLPEKHRVLRQQIVISVQLGMSFLVRSQVRRGELAGGFPRVTASLSPDDPRLANIPGQQIEEIRIDYVQHALAAMLSYHQLMEQHELPGWDR